MQSKLLIPKSVARERRNGGDVDELRKQIHNLGVLARAPSRDKRATYRGEFTPNVGGLNRRQRRARAKSKEARFEKMMEQIAKMPKVVSRG